MQVLVVFQFVRLYMVGSRKPTFVLPPQVSYIVACDLLSVDPKLLDSSVTISSLQSEERRALQIYSVQPETARQRETVCEPRGPGRAM
jgi:hypothetical protein